MSFERCTVDKHPIEAMGSKHHQQIQLYHLEKSAVDGHIITLHHFILLNPLKLTNGYT
jgi:hypothetical protein